MGAGLVAMVVFSSPNFAHLPVVEVLAIAIAFAAIVAVTVPIDWDRIPRLAMAVPLVGALVLGWSGIVPPGSPSFFISVGVGAVIIVAVYAVPWEVLPRWAHNFPVFGGIAAVFVFQATVKSPYPDATTALLVFPLVLTTVLFTALYHTRTELFTAAGIASIGLLALALLKRNQTGELGTAVLVTVVLWVVVVSVHQVVRQSRMAAAEAARFAAALERDVAARKKAEEAVQELNTALQIANQHKSEFLANMSHELRTPLNAILGFSELLMDDVTDKFDVKARRRFLSQVNSSGRHLLALINDILDLSKVEAGQMVLRIESVPIDDSVREVIATIDPLATKKSIRLEADVNGAGQVPADPGKLRQMLLNLVSNAVKFTPEGGRVTITARRNTDTMAISVSDTGIGIALADQRTLFQEFHQLDSTTSRPQEGTGLGLALTKRFVELHRGSIGIVSELGKGSVFTLTLPLVRKDLDVSAPAPELPKTINDTRPLILVVEDNLQAANLLKRYLDRGGFRSVVAVDGAEAISKARELRPVAITLDILLPGIDGWDVLTELKHLEATRDIPVVVISVVDNPELGLALGAIDYLVKPVDGKALLQRLTRYTFTNKVGTQETHILVVDDEPANLEWLKGVLTPAGFSVTSAGGGQEGIDAAKSGHPDLVLLDLMMPRVSGFDVVEALRADESTRSIPIMVLTAKDLTSEDKRQLNGHVAAILSRGATGAPDLLGWLERLVTARTPA
jgi:signal transduction histidine kinase/DNA-binding response OmpR family regulator